MRKIKPFYQIISCFFFAILGVQIKKLLLIDSIENLVFYRSFFGMLLLLITILIYVIFKSKRKQRLIALIQEDNNTSLQFVNTMSMLYLKQNNHHAIIKQKKKIFLHFLRSRYFLTIKDIDKQFIEHLSKVSQIENDRIELIFKYFNAATSNREFSNGDLADLHNNIEFFYKNCA